MKSFGPLLRQLRGTTPLTETARRMGISKGYLANLEAGRRVPDNERAEHLLRRGFGLRAPAARRRLWDVQLRDAGLRDPDLRRLVLDLIQRQTPPLVRHELRRLVHRYSGRPGPSRSSDR